VLTYLAADRRPCIQEGHSVKIMSLNMLLGYALKEGTHAAAVWLA
jgi:hypothetical protein